MGGNNLELKKKILLKSELWIVWHSLVSRSTSEVIIVFVSIWLNAFLDTLFF